MKKNDDKKASIPKDMQHLVKMAAIMGMSEKKFFDPKTQKPVPQDLVRHVAFDLFNRHLFQWAQEMCPKIPT